jgi:hypothetical protein
MELWRLGIGQRARRQSSAGGGSRGLVRGYTVKGHYGLCTPYSVRSTLELNALRHATHDRAGASVSGDGLRWLNASALTYLARSDSSWPRGDEAAQAASYYWSRSLTAFTNARRSNERGPLFPLILRCSARRICLVPASASGEVWRGCSGRARWHTAHSRFCDSDSNLNAAVVVPAEQVGTAVHAAKTTMTRRQA